MSKEIKIRNVKDLEHCKSSRTKRWDTLPDDLIKRLTRVKEILGDADHSETLEDFLIDFHYDRNPERETETWEWIADKYQKKILKGRPVELKGRRNLLRSIMHRSIQIFPMIVEKEE